MLYALNGAGERSAATPNSRAICPGCRDNLIPKCGAINIWHWAHRAGDCDPWYEPESDWHLYWKSLVPKERTEVVMPPHRADIVASDGTVIELQHSNIDAISVCIRQEFYKNIIWLVDALPFRDHLSFREKDGFYTFVWKHARKHHTFMDRLIWDLGGGHGLLFKVEKIYPPQKEGWKEFGEHQLRKIPARSAAGWGRYVNREKFVRWLRGENK